jgi:hypothetical protein
MLVMVEILDDLEVLAGVLMETATRVLMSIGTILLIVFVLLLVGAFPSWPHSRSWGYYPSGGLGLVVVVLLILLLLGRI